MPISLASGLFGVPAVRTVVRGLQQVVGAGLTHEELSRIGVIVDGLISQLSSAGVADASRRTRLFSEATMRFYGIKQWAEGVQSGVEASMLGHLAELSGKTLAEADERPARGDLSGVRQ